MGLHHTIENRTKRKAMQEVYNFKRLLFLRRTAAA
jgi:hypothetical protein